MNFHFFGSTAMHWATGATREEVLLKLWTAAGAATIEQAYKEDPLYAWTCMVEGDKATPYKVEYFHPTGVATADAREFDLLPKKQWREVIRCARCRFNAATRPLPPCAHGEG